MGVSGGDMGSLRAQLWQLHRRTGELDDNDAGRARLIGEFRCPLTLE
jgi:hypothetical protein